MTRFNVQINICHSQTRMHQTHRPNDRSVEFQQAIAIHAVGKSVALSALGYRPTRIVMPGPTKPPYCDIRTPMGNGARGRLNKRGREHGQLESIFLKVAGPAALVYMNDRDYFGEIGLGDIESTYDQIDVVAAEHDLEPAHVLGACEFAFGHVASKHLDMMFSFTDEILSSRHLDQCEICRFLGSVNKTDVGHMIAAAAREPWISDYSDEVHKGFIGN
jgi:hypothetical protein